MNWESANALKQQTPLYEYLESQQWKPIRRMTRGRLLGLCPIHHDHSPSFLVDTAKNLFYCYGCGRGGDVIRFVELYHGVKFSQAMSLLRSSFTHGSLLHDAASYYRMQLHRHSLAVSYLHQRGVHNPSLIDELEIGYAPGNCLRRWMMSLGYSLDILQQAGLVNRDGHDTFSHRIVFPLDNNLYGRSTGSAAPHRCLPNPKGGLYDWHRVKQHSEIILVEGLFDLASVRQAGFRNITCSLGARLNALQFRQLCDGAARTVYLVFDADANGGGQNAARNLCDSLARQQVKARIATLPDGHDPNSFFVSGGTAAHFRKLLEQACP